MVRSLAPRAAAALLLAALPLPEIASAAGPAATTPAGAAPARPSAERLRVMAPMAGANRMTHEAKMSVILYSALAIGIVIAIVAIKSDDELPASP